MNKHSSKKIEIFEIPISSKSKHEPKYEEWRI